MEEDRVLVKWRQDFYNKYKDIFNIEVALFPEKTSLEMEGYSLNPTKTIIRLPNVKEPVGRIQYSSDLVMFVPSSCLEIFKDLEKIEEDVCNYH